MTTTAVLWDIDGTLLRAAGTGQLSYAAALRVVTGADYPPAGVYMGGRTDPDIAALVLAAAGFDDPSLVPALLAELDAHYHASAEEFRALTSAKPGAAQALDAFEAAAVVQTVVTGNLRSIARHKVEAAGLQHHLRLEHGGYGSDHRIRTELVRISQGRLAAGGFDVDPQRTWIIGDTSRDLDCAREAGVRCVLVATGTEAIETLQLLGADAVFADLTDLDRLSELVIG